MSYEIQCFYAPTGRKVIAQGKAKRRPGLGASKRIPALKGRNPSAWKPSHRCFALCGLGRIGSWHRSVSFLLQMGPRLVSRGKILAILDEAADQLSSMGPRLVSRGKFRQVGRAPWYDHASMGPRLVSRGKANAQTHSQAFARLLQWGRDLLVAERAQETAYRQLETLLQWGRDLLVAERASTSVSRQGFRLCFNGAATC